ncbi:unnamed protein product [Spirodela intermedia]|uniref:Uncharacterized protein n=1 Tax=Spirodela intermedia TaxID=51605 RepID=A0ABN7E8Y8_SPIIN|nr:unnamed protein product [Spirodela intermedia]
MGCQIISGGCHLAEWKNDDFEVTTCLLTDRPLLDDGLFVDQWKMLYSMDSLSFYHNHSKIYGHTHARKRLALKCSITIYSSKTLAHKRCGTKPVSHLP